MNRALSVVSIDDSKAVHAFLGQCLSGHRVKHFLSGREAIQFLSGPHEPIDIILLDWEMPEMTGPEVFEKLRHLEGLAPVVMLTSKNKPEDIRLMLAAGVHDYVLKPFTQDILLSRIFSVLGMAA